MYSILSIATTITLLSSLFVCLKWGRLRCHGTVPTSLLTFCAILFTSGLDASIFPSITNGNINAPTMMVAERAADLIKAKGMLDAIDAAFFEDPQWQTRQRAKSEA